MADPPFDWQCDDPEILPELDPFLDRFLRWAIVVWGLLMILLLLAILFNSDDGEFHPNQIYHQTSTTGR